MSEAKFNAKEYRAKLRAEKAESSALEKRKNSPISYILEQQKIRVRQDMLRLRIAIDACENIYNYNRYLLHNVYREIIKDPNLNAQWTSRKMKTLEKPFKWVNESGDEVPEMTKKFEVQWFYDWIDSALDSKLWGFTCMEFGPLMDGIFLPYTVQTDYGVKIYNPITILDRDNVKPELGIITHMPGDKTGLSIADPKYSSYVMLISSDYRDQGLLGKLAKYILFKDNALGNWSEWAEVFGMDVRIGKTDTTGPDRQAFIQAIRDMGSNAYGVFTSRDEVEYVGTQRTDAFQVYNELIRYLDSQTSKLVFGQDVVSNETGKLKGTVGENISNMYGDNDARFIAGLVNFRLKPFMENLGFDFGGTSFKWDSTEKLKLADRADVDLKISQMGFTIDPDYIVETYGTPVEVKEMPEPLGKPGKTPEEELKAMYEK